MIGALSRRRHADAAPPPVPALRLPTSAPRWSLELAPDTVPSPVDSRQLSPGVVARLALLDSAPQTFHHSDESYVKLGALFRNGILDSKGYSAQVIRGLQKAAVIVGSPQMVADWSRDEARRGAEAAYATATGKQSERGFVCLEHALDALQALRVGLFRRKLSTEQIYRTLGFLTEYKRVSENRYACSHMLAERRNEYERHRCSLQKTLDNCVQQIWNDPTAWMMRRDMEHLTHLCRPARPGV